MAVIVLPNRAAGVRPPFSGVYGDSLQALNLVLWYPIRGQGVELPASVGGGSTALALQNANTSYQTDPRYRYSVKAVIADPLGRTSGPDNVAVSSEFSLSFWFKWDDSSVWCAAISKAGALETNSGELSMGMTNDYEIAIEEGATMLRIGSAIFGQRNTLKDWRQS